MRWMLALAAVALLIVLLLPSGEAPRARATAPAPTTPPVTAEEGESEGEGTARTGGAASVSEEEKGSGEEEEECRLTVVSNRDGSPISGAQVIDSRDRSRGVTGADGVIEFRTMDGWHWVSAAGWFPTSFLAGYGAYRDIWVALPPAGPLSGKVLDASTRGPIAGARIEIRCADSGKGVRASSDAQGRFEIQGALSEPYVLVARAEGYTPAEVRGLLAGPLRGLELALDGGGTLEGRLLKAEGGTRGGWVYLRAGGKTLPHLSDWAGKQGEYRISGVPLGIEVVPWTDPRAISCAPVVFRSKGEVQRRDILFPAHVELVVTAAGPSGEPVELSFPPRLSHTHKSYLGWLDADGWHFSALPGRYRLEMTADGWPDQSREVDLTSGRVHEVIEFASGLAIVGSVVASDGTPVEAVVRWDGGFATTDVQGRFRIDGLPPEPLRLSACLYPDHSDASLEGVVPGGPPVTLVGAPAARVTGRLLCDDGYGLRTSSEIRNGAWSLRSDGRFEVVVSDPFEPLLLAFRRGEGAAPAVFSLPPLGPGGSRDLGEIRLDDGRIVRGRVVGADDEPLAGASVRVAEPWATHATARTDGAGSFCLLRMPVGPFSVRVEAAGYPPHFVQVGGDATIRLSAGGVAAGDGRARIRPAWLHESAENAVIWARPGPDGRFEMRVQPGDYRGWAEDEKGEKTVELLPFTVRTGETTEVEVKPR